MLVELVNRVPPGVAARFRSGSPAARLLAPALELFLPRETVEVVVRSGAAAGIRLPIEPQREKYYWTGAYETEVQRAVQGALGPGACFWDVGAHVGFFTALAARSVGPNGCVHSFEPMPANRARLLRTVELNGLEQVEVHPTALAGRSGTRALYGHTSTSMWSLVGPRDARGVEVRCATLDDLVAEGSLGTPTAVKIDAEGAELEILRGGLRLISETRVALIVEFTSPGVVDEARSLLPSRVFEPLSDRHWLLRRAE